MDEIEEEQHGQLEVATAQTGGRAVNSTLIGRVDHYSNPVQNFNLTFNSSQDLQPERVRNLVKALANPDKKLGQATIQGPETAGLSREDSYKSDGNEICTKESSTKESSLSLSRDEGYISSGDSHVHKSEEAYPQLKVLFSASLPKGNGHSPAEESCSKETNRRNITPASKQPSPDIVTDRHNPRTDAKLTSASGFQQDVIKPSKNNTLKRLAGTGAFDDAKVRRSRREIDKRLLKDQGIGPHRTDKSTLTATFSCDKRENASVSLEANDALEDSDMVIDISEEERTREREESENYDNSTAQFFNFPEREPTSSNQDVGSNRGNEYTAIIDFTDDEKRALPTKTAYNQTRELCLSKTATIVIGNKAEGEFFTINTIGDALAESGYNKYYFTDINDLAERHHKLPANDKAVVVVWHISDVIRSKKKVSDLLQTIARLPVETNRKYIFCCQPWNLKFLKIHVNTDLFDETNTVNLTDINSHENQWRERLELLDTIDSNIERRTKEKIAKTTPVIGGFPLLCAQYRSQGVAFFENPNKLAKSIFRKIISTHGNKTAAAFVLMVACNGTCNENELRKASKGSKMAEHYKQVDIVGSYSKEVLLETLRCWNGTILKEENGTWTFSNAIWKKECTMFLYAIHDRLFEYLHKPCSRSLWERFWEMLVKLLPFLSAS